MARRRPVVDTACAIATCVLAVAFTAYAVHDMTDEPAPSLIPAYSVVMTEDSEAAYDRGFGDGVEYESWFCAHDVTP